MALWDRLRGIWRVRSYTGFSVGRIPKRDYEDIKKTNTALMPLLFLGLAATFWIGFRAHSVGPILLWSVSCLTVGATIGFLFGIPRSNAQAVNLLAKEPKTGEAANQWEGEAGRPNTNLEEVSDWLTKIIVGLSLVHLKSIEGRIESISLIVAASLKPIPTASDTSTAMALVVGFSVLGFLFGYLYTRLFLQGAFSRSNGEMREWREAISEVLSNTKPEEKPDAGQPSIPSLFDRQAAERILQIAPVSSPEEILAPLRTLAADYERIRRDMPSSDERTRKMAEVAKNMKTFGFVAAPFLPQLTQSISPGERLAAVMVLQMRFDPNYIDWLANRLLEEPAFCGFQAISALVARVAIVGGVERERIKAAVKGVMDSGAAVGLRLDGERHKLCEKVLGS